MKKTKTMVALLFIFLMVASTFAMTAMQTFNGQRSSGHVELPNKNVIDFEMGLDQESLAISKGFTVAKFYHYMGCQECGTRKSFLEYMASQYPDQIIVEEILTGNTASLSLTSYLGQKKLVNATQDQIFNAFCGLMSKPPAACAIR